MIDNSSIAKITVASTREYQETIILAEAVPQKS
jgi:hypothetical protein